MSSLLIGQLLDEILHWAYRQAPVPVIPAMPSPRSDQETERKQLQPRSVARVLLAEHLRQCFTGAGIHPFGEEGEPYPNHERIRVLCRDTRFPLLPDPELAAHVPDLVLGEPGGGCIKVIEVGYGFEPDIALAAVDRLLSLQWVTSPTVGARPADFVAYVFVHECGFGDIVYEVERAYMDWIEAHYGPINGSDRIYLPMMPRLTRSSKISPRDGTVVSSIDLETRPTGFIAFCISCEHERY